MEDLEYELTPEEIEQAKRPPVEPRYGAGVHVTDGPQVFDLEDTE